MVFLTDLAVASILTLSTCAGIAFGMTEEITLQDKQVYTFEYNGYFSTKNYYYNYDVRSPPDTTIYVVCNIKMKCTDDAYTYIVNDLQQQLLYTCSNSEEFEKTVQVESQNHMMIQMYSGNTHYSRYSCELKVGISGETVIKPTAEPVKPTPAPPVPVKPTPAPPAPVKPTLGPDSGSCQCGQALDNSRIVGGVEATPGEFPWQVSLQWYENNAWHFYCGGSILSADYALTAGHCLNQYQTMVELYVGSTNVFQGGYRVGISKIMQHEGFNKTYLFYDVTLIKTSKPFTFSNLVFPICLPRALASETFVNKQMMISGFGKVHVNGGNSETLLRATIMGIPHQYCIWAYDEFRIKDYMLCASAFYTDTCQGDSGGPLTYTSPQGINYLAGAVSWGTGCADPRYPGVYSRMTSYLDWIDANTDYKICSR